MFSTTTHPIFHVQSYWPSYLRWRLSSICINEWKGTPNTSTHLSLVESVSHFNSPTDLTFADPCSSSNHWLWGPCWLAFLCAIHYTLCNSITPDPPGSNTIRSIDIHGPRSNHHLSPRRAFELYPGQVDDKDIRCWRCFIIHSPSSR